MISPFSTLTTDRLMLRQFAPDDAAAVLHYFSDADMLKYVDFGPLAELSEAESVIRWGERILAEQEGILWGLYEPHDARLIGTLNYRKRPEDNGTCHRAEISYDLVPTHWGRGLMLEAIRATLPYPFEVLGMARVETVVHLGNLRSGRVLLKAGFRLEGVLRKYGSLRGVLSDVMFFALLREEWEAQRGRPADY